LRLTPFERPEESVINRKKESWGADFTTTLHLLGVFRDFARPRGRGYV